MSIDGYGDHNRYIRYPTDWSKVQENFDKAMMLPAKVQLKIYFVYQAWNVFDVARLIHWLDTNQTRRVDFVPIFLEHPDHLHSCVWPRETQHYIIGQLLTIETVRHRDPVQRIINYTQNTNKYSVENLQRMKQFIDINDRYRKYKFADVFPKLNYILEESCKT
jgi:sulfatase maturation enzyme AslB (radical SAM superfamily)